MHVDLTKCTPDYVNSCSVSNEYCKFVRVGHFPAKILQIIIFHSLIKLTSTESTSVQTPYNKSTKTRMTYRILLAFINVEGKRSTLCPLNVNVSDIYHV